jgi:hypothetical protein
MLHANAASAALSASLVVSRPRFSPAFFRSFASIAILSSFSYLAFDKAWDVPFSAWLAWHLPYTS